ncbi:MAG: hypothetical protein D6731_01375 [Planctomycetota bacterium]|nr:MAG: hypothetical protein D6731_01375 [Planctomycetota bacterium]
MVRLSAPRAPEVEVFLSVEFETREVAEHRVVAEATPGEALDVRFLLVHGPRALPEDLTLPDVHLVDASEETRLGHAPQVGVRAVTRRRKQLPLKTGLRAFVWST